VLLKQLVTGQLPKTSLINLNIETLHSVITAMALQLRCGH